MKKYYILILCIFIILLILDICLKIFDDRDRKAMFYIVLIFNIISLAIFIKMKKKY